MLTAKGEVEDRIIGLELGADDYLVKPFSPRELVARARALLRRVHADSEPQREVLEFGELTIDVSGHKVLVNNEEIDLTASEFKLLTTLSRYPGRVYSRMELVEKVLGYDFEGYERTIDSHVKNLRAKIGDNPRSPKWLHTVHGVGYRRSLIHIWCHVRRSCLEQRRRPALVACHIQHRKLQGRALLPAVQRMGLGR